MTRLERQYVGGHIVGVRPQFAERTRHRRKRTAVMDRRTEPVQSLEMLGHAVAHVTFETIARIGGPKACHQPVARDLGDDGSGRDGGDEPIAADDRLAIATHIDAVAAIDKNQTRLYR